VVLRVVQGRKGVVLRQISKLAGPIEQPAVIDAASVRRIRFQHKITGIGCASHCERRAATGGHQMRQALRNSSLYMGTVSPKVEHRSVRVLAAFGYDPENMLTIRRKAIQNEEGAVSTSR
jgi:hypothetical protein